MLKVKLFGPGEASYQGRMLTGFPNQQCYLLLCYLLLNSNRLHSRDHLAALFWGEYPTSVSRKYLRNSLWRLRQALELVGVPVDQYLMTNDEYISFVAGGEYWLDVELFQDAASSSQYIMGRDLTSVQVTRLEQAIELYTGDLLNDVYDDWCLYDRERLSLMYLNGLSKLMSVYEAVGNYERGIDCGKRILAKDSIRENIHLQLMKLYWMSGDRNTALLQYKRCSQILKEELGISPLIETTNTYQQMVNNQYIPNRLEGDSDIQIIPSTTIHPNAKHALQKLQHLHSMIEDASNEIKHLERLINSFLTDSEQV